jgi:hypothetical protein
MTAYRQQALACAAALSCAPARPRDLKNDAPDAATILLRNVYGWFVRVERGFYALSDSGRAALALWKAHLPAATAEELTVAAASYPTLPLAELPQAPRRLHVLSLLARLPLLPVEEVFAAHVGHVGRRRESHQRVGADRGRARHEVEGRHADVGQQPIATIEARGHEPGMVAVGCNTRAFETAGELGGEQDVGELGLAVASEAAIRAFGIDIVEGDAGTLMRAGGRGDAPGG